MRERINSILIEGASTAAGWYDKDHGGWAARLHTGTMTYNERKPYFPFLVMNRARPGTTITSINAMLPCHLRETVDNTTVVLQTGMNEAKVNTLSGHEIMGESEFADQLYTFANMCQAHGAAVLFVASQPLNAEQMTIPTANLRIEDAAMARRAAIMGKVAADAGEAFLDTRAIFTAAGTENVICDVDNAHPNERGHAVLAQHISIALRSIGAL